MSASFSKAIAGLNAIASRELGQVRNVRKKVDSEIAAFRKQKRWMRGWRRSNPGRSMNDALVAWKEVQP